MTVTLRPAAPEDEPFIRRLIVDTVSAELGASAWPEPMRSHLLGIQFTARRHSRRGGSRVIQVDGDNAGWTVIDAMPHEVRLVEIMVLPELRGKGIGSAVINGIIAAASQGTPVRLNVNVANHAAIRLYERLGFRKVGREGVQWLMESVR